MNYRNAGIALIAASALMLAGCPSLPQQATEHGSVTRTTTKADGSKEVTENASDYKAYTQAKLELAKRPIFKMECPDAGCVMKSLEVSAPGAGSDIAAPAPPPKVEHAAVGIARELKETFLGLAPIAQPIAIVHGMARYGGKIADRFGASIDTIAENVSRPNQVTVSGNNSAAAVGGSATSTGPNSGAQSGNSGRINSNDANTTNSGSNAGNSGRINSNDANNANNSTTTTTNPPPAP